MIIIKTKRSSIFYFFFFTWRYKFGYPSNEMNGKPAYDCDQDDSDKEAFIYSRSVEVVAEEQYRAQIYQ